MAQRHRKTQVVFLNPRTCGINKDGGTRYRVDPLTSRRTKEVDNEMAAQVDAYLRGERPDGMSVHETKEVSAKGVLVPRYYDQRWNQDITALCERESLQTISLAQLQADGILKVREGHGSPSSDFRTGTIPYVKVSDIRSLRVNVNPTNLIPLVLAKKFWRGEESGLKAWDLISPNRASNNIGEFAILLPGEERLVVTKEVFIFRVAENEKGWDAFYLLWALCLRAVRRQWQRVTLMQTNREDVADRYKEVLLPAPPDAEWARKVSAPFRDYFTTISEAKREFTSAVEAASYDFIASIKTMEEPAANADDEEAVAETTSEDADENAVAPGLLAAAEEAALARTTE